MTDPNPFDMRVDEIVATVELVGRSGGRELELGHLDDVPDSRAARWYAHAKFRGARLTTDEHPGPVEALDALARKILTGAQCQHCGGVVTLSPDGAWVYTKSTLITGARWDVETTSQIHQCRWRRIGAHWRRGCEATTHNQPTPEAPR